MAAKVEEPQKRIYIELGKRIREARENKRLSQADLASSSFLSRTSITNIEKGRQHLPLHTLYAIANALEIKMVELLPDLSQSDGKLTLDSINEELQTKEREWIKSEVENLNKK